MNETQQEAVLKAWLESGDYLPDFLRDFHDAKDFFKICMGNRDIGRGLPKEITWVEGQIYTVDMFLWVAALYGYTMQPSRKKKPFKDLQKRLNDAKGIIRDKFMGELPSIHDR